MNVWYISDLHVGHAVVARKRAGDASLCAPWLAHQSELDAFVTRWHDRTLAAEWDSVVKPDDLVWVLGDISSGTDRAQNHALDWIADRPGRKRLVAGNHDGAHPMHRDAYRWLRKYMAVFETVQSAARVRIAGVSVLLSHFPYVADHSDPPRHMQWRLPDLGELLIHGHTHSAERRGGREIHVGVDAWGLRPVALQQIELLVEAATIAGADRTSRQIIAALEGAPDQ